MQPLATLDDLASFLAFHPAALIYFGAGGCGVCDVLRPRIVEMAAERFPQLALAYVETPAAPDVAGQQRVFAIPTVVVFFEGRELLRRARHFSPAEIAAEIDRPYALFFE